MKISASEIAGLASERACWWRSKLAREMGREVAGEEAVNVVSSLMPFSSF